MATRILSQAAPALAAATLLLGCAGDDAGGDGDDAAVDGTGAEGTGGDDGNSDSADDGGDSGSSGDGNSGEESTGGPVAQGIPVLGNYGHTLDDVQLELILETDLSRPTDAEISPHNPEELWITNQGNNSITIVVNPGEGQEVDWKGAPGDNGGHFLAKPAAIAFGQDGVMATAQQTNEITQPGTPADFMGPTMWTSERAVFNGGHLSHLDMLHNSPNASGITWESGNAYWVFDGDHGSLTRYDFHEDHDLGGTDHTDGEVHRAVDGQLSFFPGVAAHIAYDQSTGLLYSVDPGTNRIMVLDTQSGTVGTTINPNYDGGTQNFLSDCDFQVFVDGSDLDAAMSIPSGLEIHDGMIFVTDHEMGTVAAFDMEGELVDWLDTGWDQGTLMGLTFDPDGRMYLVDSLNDRVYRVSAL